LRGLVGELQGHGVSLALAEVSPLVRSRLARYGVLEILGEGSVFETIQDAVNAGRTRNEGPSTGGTDGGASDHPN
jgi:hypothetical protein